MSARSARTPEYSLRKELIDFEKRVELSHKSFIDGYVSSTRTIIEQRSRDINLDKAAKQSDGSVMTPFEQAKRYSDWLPDSERARWIITCNFKNFTSTTWNTRKLIQKLSGSKILNVSGGNFYF